jgi:hypothetical protein
LLAITTKPGIFSIIQHGILQWYNRESLLILMYFKDIDTTISNAIKPGSAVGIETGYEAGRSGNRIPVGARFSAPTQPPIQCTTGLSRE